MHFLGGVQVPGIDNHLAKSTDGGNSFTFVKNLFPSVAITNPANPSPQGYLESETSNLPLLLQPVSSLPGEIKQQENLLQGYGEQVYIRNSNY